MYYGVPHLTAGERLMRLPPLDLSSIAVTPAAAASQLKDPPRRLRISMHRDRPVYRFNTGRVFGRWTLVYADTGERVAPLDRDDAVACGLVSLDIIPGIRESRYSPQQIANGARSVQGEGAVLALESLTLDGLRAAAATVSRSFQPRELELLQFGNEPYLIAYRAPTPETVADWSSRSGVDFIPDARRRPRVDLTASTRSYVRTLR